MVSSRIQMPLWTIHAVRLQLLALLASVMAVVASSRASLSMALLCIVGTTNSSSNCYEPMSLPWSVQQQALVHSAFYAGAFVAVFAANNLILRFGPKHVICATLMTTAAGAFSMPPTVILFHSAAVLAVLRAIMGFGYGFLVPAASVLICKWFPLSEKSTAMAVFTTGNQLGIASSMLITAKLSQVPLIRGWPLALLLYGTLASVILVVWAVVAADKPRRSRYITAVELEHIGGRRTRTRTDTAPVPTPYKKILLNPCVNAICWCSFAQSFVLVGLVTYLPLFNQSAMRMHMSWNGLWSALPFCAQVFAKMAMGTAADKMKEKRVSVTIVTKSFNALASLGTALLLLPVAFLGEDSGVWASLLVSLSMVLFSAYVAGYNTSVVSVLPQFTAFVSAYSQLYAQIGSALAPIILGAVQRKDGDWSVVFYILSGVLLISGIGFQFFGHGRSEKWADVNSEVLEANQRLAADPTPRSHRPSTRVSYRDEIIE